MDSRLRKVADRARLEREGDRIMEAKARHEKRRKNWRRKNGCEGHMEEMGG